MAKIFRIDSEFLRPFERIAKAGHRSVQSVFLEAAERGLPLLENGSLRKSA